jgi:hypothetical protein
MSSERGVRPGPRASDLARAFGEPFPFVSPSSDEIERCDPSAMLIARHARSLARRAGASIERAPTTTARLMLPASCIARSHAASTPRARVVAERSDGRCRATASFVENFSLAHMRASDGIKHGTVRNESTPRVRSVSNPPITQSTVRQETSPRVTPSRLTAPSPMFPGAWLSRSDQTSVGCNSREDQGGPQ